MSHPSITTEVKQLLLGKNFASLATLMKNGSPHVAPTWIDYDEDMILINTAAGRIKEKNVKYDSRVALSIYEAYHHLVSFFHQYSKIWPASSSPKF